MSTISTPLHSFTARRVHSKPMSDLKKAEAEKLYQFELQAIPLMPLMYGMARKMCGTANAEYVEDLVSETYIKAFKSWHTYEQGTKLSAWMITIMRNTLTNLQLKENKSKKFTSFDALEEWQRDRNPESLTARTNQSAEAEALANMPSKVIDEALAKINPDFREVIDHVLIQGYSYAETAKILGIPQNTVGTRLGRGKDELRALLSSYAKQEGYNTNVQKKTRAKK